MIKNDKWIRESGILDPCYEFTNEIDAVIEENQFDMYGITFAKGRKYKKKIISKGLSSYGYDLTCATEFKIFKNVDYTDPRYPHSIVDPKEFDNDNYTVHTGDYCIIPPNSFVLTNSVEYIQVPRNIIGICMGKSTYARCGINTNTTQLQPGWKGHLVIELSNTSPLPVKVYANEGIASVIFLEASEECEISYSERKGKYMFQTGITEPKV